LYDFSGQNIDEQEETEQKGEQFECYYCNDFTLITDRKEYEKHVVLKHPNMLAYPSILDLEKMNIPPKGKTWEI
jgi:hypothetical protein